MAEENIVTNITANANFSNLISDLNRVTASLTNLQTQVAATNKSLASQISVVNRQFGDTLRSTGQFATFFASAGNDVEKFGQNLDKGRLKLRDYYRVWQDHQKTASGLIRELSQQQVRLQNSIMQPLGRNAEGIMQYAVHIPRGLDLVKNKTALTHQELKIMNRVMQEGANQLINWGKNTQWAGRQLTVGLSLPLAAFGKAASDAFRTADEQLVRLTKVYGDLGGATRQELTQVRKDVANVAKELATGYGASFNETLGLAADIAATGKTGQELLGSIKETTRLAVLGEVDRQDAMKATLAIQTAFNQNTQELSDSINFLNAVENQTSTSLADLIEAIPKAGPVVKGLGGSVKDLALYLTAMREGGINAAEGANAIKSSLASLINPTKVAQEKFKSFGIDLMDIVTRNAGNVTGTLLELQSALDRLDPLQKQQAIEQLFGKFQFARMGALFDNLGKQGSQTLKVLDLMKASSADLANVAAREIGQVTESASGKYRRALESLKADLATVGEQFLTINTFVIKVIDNIVKFASNLPGPVKQILSLIGGVTAIAGPLIMLTGVLGNFFGYIVKGVYHFKSLFKGAEGWRMLTPDILAANKAGTAAETTFYNDARAATILNQALKDLSIQYDNLAIKAQSGAISVSPLISTVGGTPIATGGGMGREVNPRHKLVGSQETRASAHMVPRKIDQPRTIFGLVPGSMPLNLAIGENPQVYMQEDLPMIPGVTSVQTKKYGQVSTGVIASEAAKHHAMMATLAMQGKDEVEKLKKMMATTGTVTSEFMGTFDDLLPITTRITQNAAAETAAIVAELRAGKLTVDQARSKIISLNIEIENMLASATSEYAAATGRSINLRNVPTMNQPVTDFTGKSNMRELFKSRTKGFFGSVARALGVKTYGAGYNIETTIPKKFNTGGYVYTMNDGNIVPGPNVNADVVPAMLTPGEFVVNRKAAQENLPLLMAINGGAGSGGPGFNKGGFMPARMLWQGSRANMILAHPSQTNRRASLGLGPGDKIPGSLFAQDFIDMQKKGVHPAGLMYDIGTRLGYSTKDMRIIFNDMNSQLIARLNNAGDITPQEYDAITNSVVTENLNKLRRYSKSIGRQVSLQQEIESLGFTRGVRRGIVPGSLRQLGFDGQNIPQPFISTGGGMPAGMAEAHFQRMQELFPESERKSSPGFGNKRSFRTLFGAERGHIGTSLPFSGATRNIGLTGPSVAKSSIESHGSNTFLGMPLRRVANKWVKFGFDYDPIGEAMRSRMRFAPGAFRPYRRNSGGLIGMNSGGMVPGYNKGGGVVNYRRGYYGDFLGMPGMGPGTWSPAMGGHRTESRFTGSGGGFMAGMGMQMAGGAIGGSTGNAMMLGGLAMQMYPMLKPLMSAMSSIKTIPSMLSGIGAAARTALMVAGNAFRFLTGPVGLTITGLTIAGKLLLDWKKRAQEAGEANRLAFGGTEKSFTSVGIKNYKTISDRIKEVNEQLELHRAKVRSTYESYTKAGPTGLTLTIKELKESIKYAKENQKEYVKAFDTIGSSRVVDYAAQLKAQFVSMGMSASDATNQIYSIVKASSKSSQAIAAISSTAFRAIQDQTSGIKSMIDLLSKSLTGRNFNPEEFTQGMDTLVSSLLAFQQGLIGTKDKMGNILDQADALAITLKKVKDLNGSNVQISGNQLDAIKQQSLVYQGILGKVETLQSMYAKIALYQQGFGDMLNLSAMNSQDVLAFANSLTTIQNTLTDITSSTSDNNPLGPLASAIATAEKQSKDAGKAVKALKTVSSDYYDNLIKKINKTIDALEKERKKRLEVLAAAKASQDYATSIQQSKNKIQNLVAGGQLDAAAEEQLNLQKMINDRQYNLTEDRINKEFDLKVEKQKEAEKKAQDDKDKLTRGTAAAGANAAVKSANLAELQNYMTQLNTIATKNIGKSPSQFSADDLKEISNILKSMKDSGNALAKSAAAGLEKKYGFTTGPDEVRGGAKPNISRNILAGLTKSVDNRAASDETFASAVAAFKLAVEKFSGKTNTDNPKSSKEFGADRPKVVTGKTLKEAAKQVQTGKVQARKFTGPAGDVYDLFTHNGISYAMDSVGGIYFYDSQEQKLGKKVNISGRATFGRVVPGRDYIVGERGPELFRTDVPGNVMPKYNIPTGNYSLDNSANNGTMIGKMSLTQNIYASPGMDENALANLAAKQAVAFIKQENQNNNYRVGRGVSNR